MVAVLGMPCVIPSWNSNSNNNGDCLGGVMVSVLDIGSNVCRFIPGSGDGFLRVIKIHSIPSFTGEIKPEAPHCKILQHVKYHLQV
jgi:hypothetical protein